MNKEQAKQALKEDEKSILKLSLPILVCSICGDASGDCECCNIHLDEEDLDDSWFTDPNEGAR